MKKVLHLNLYRKYFDQILKGEKTTEYREVTPHWSKRLEGRDYDVIQFRNGYAKVAPMMIVEFKGMGIVTFQTTSTYAIELGEILETKNVAYR
tara:strand:- start:67 stop:345 length:279 start_codon:yes stop_codon:yes gene_type:complete